MNLSFRLWLLSKKIFPPWFGWARQSFNALFPMTKMGRMRLLVFKTLIFPVMFFFCFGMPKFSTLVSQEMLQIRTQGIVSIYKLYLDDNLLVVFNVRCIHAGN